MPLELVINKDSKSRENCSDSNSAECGSSNLHENVTFDKNEEAYESVANDDVVTNDNSGEVCIPKIDPYSVALNIENHLRNDDNRDSKNLQNVKNVNTNLIF